MGIPFPLIVYALSNFRTTVPSIMLVQDFRPVRISSRLGERRLEARLHRPFVLQSLQFLLLEDAKEWIRYGSLHNQSPKTFTADSLALLHQSKVGIAAKCIVKIHFNSNSEN